MSPIETFATVRAPTVISVRARSAVALAWPTALALAVAWIIAHDGARIAAALIVVVPLVAYVLRKPENGLIVAAAAIIAIPYSTTIGLPQADVNRLAAITALAGFAVIGARRGDGGRFRVVDAAVVAFIAFALISWYSTSHPTGALAATLNVLAPFSFYFAGRVFGAAAEKLLRVVLVAGAIGAASVVYEMFVAHAPVFTNAASYLWSESSVSFFRPGGVFASPPGAAAVLSMIALMSVPLVRNPAGTTRWWVVGALALVIFGMLLTFTRAPIIGFGLGAMTYVVLANPGVRTIGRSVFAIGAAVLVVVFVVLPMASHTRLYEQGVARKGNLAARESLWKDALPLVHNSSTHLLIGHGINSLVVGRSMLPGQPDTDVAATPSLLAFGTHNQYVRTLFEEGIVGLGLLLTWLLGSIGAAIHALGRVADDARRQIAAYAAAIVGFLVAASAGDISRHATTLAVIALATGLLLSNLDRRRDTTR